MKDETLIPRSVKSYCFLKDNHMLCQLSTIKVIVVPFLFVSLQKITEKKKEPYGRKQKSISPIQKKNNKLMLKPKTSSSKPVNNLLRDMQHCNRGREMGGLVAASQK